MVHNYVRLQYPCQIHMVVNAWAALGRDNKNYVYFYVIFLVFLAGILYALIYF